MRHIDPETLAKAIDLVLHTAFVPCETVPDSNDESLVLAHATATRWFSSTKHGCAMRVFQNAGVPQSVVARALRTGVLRAVEVGS